MSAIRLEAQTRTAMGKGASRRLRRLENKVPAIVYGGTHAPHNVELSQNAVLKALESESIYSSVFELNIDGHKKSERVILKALQRHPFRPVILHMDLQRVASSDILDKMIPLHFINEQQAPGVKVGGVVNHVMTQIEVRCEVRHLPEFIEVDLSALELNQVWHVADIKLPKGVEFAVDPTTGDHNLPIVSVHLSKAEISETAETVEPSATTAPDSVESKPAE